MHGGEHSWKMTDWKTEKEVGGCIKTDFRERSCEDGRWMKVAQDSVQWYFVVSGVREVL